jgi:hypothetical protein
VDRSYQRWCSHQRSVLQPFHRWPEKASIEIDRKVLADLAVNEKAAFAAIVEKAKATWLKYPTVTPAPCAVGVKRHK